MRFSKILNLFTLLILCILPAQELEIMSYNIKYANENDGLYSWSNRKTALADQLNYYKPDILGMQEVVLEQRDYLLQNLKIYKSIGVARDDGKSAGEFSPIFYNQEIFTLLDSGTFWLSPNPQNPSKGWDAAFPRVCTYGKFSHKKSKKQFWVFNTHLDHVGVEARKNSLELIGQKIESLNAEKLPFILMGDLNLNDKSSEIEFFTTQMQDLFPSFLDTYHINHFGWDGTFNGYTFGTEHPRIDYIFSFGLDILSHTTITDRQKNGLWYSDHFPVMCEINLSNSRK